jgi:hypothetical protein
MASGVASAGLTIKMIAAGVPHSMLDVQCWMFGVQSINRMAAFISLYRVSNFSICQKTWHKIFAFL